MSQDGERDPFAEEYTFAQWAEELGHTYVPGSQSHDMPLRETSDERLNSLYDRAKDELAHVEDAMVERGELAAEERTAIDEDIPPVTGEHIQDYGTRVIDWLVANPDKTIFDFPG